MRLAALVEFASADSGRNEPRAIRGVQIIGKSTSSPFKVLGPGMLSTVLGIFTPRIRWTLIHASNACALDRKLVQP